MTDTAPHEERWAYGGLRVLRGKRAHAWLPEAGSGKTLLYTMTGSFSVGEVYAVTVSRADGHVTLHGTPRYGEHGRVGSDLAALLRAEHYAAQTRLALARMERSASRRDELHEALEPLRVVARQLTTRAVRTAFIAHVIAELSAALPVPSTNREVDPGE